MRLIVIRFLEFDLWIQMAILLGIIFLVIWLVAGKIMIKLASLLPCVLRVIFQSLYKLIETSICLFHKKVGGAFYNLDNGMAATGQKIDESLQQWHKKWRSPEKKYASVFIISCVILLAWLCISYKTNGVAVRFYSDMRNKLVSQLYAKEYAETTLAENNPEIPETGKKSREIVMVVSTVKDPLSIRDIPSTKGCEILDKAAKGSTVIWTGDMAFGTVDSNTVEPWVKVVTNNGIIGWTRLKYLCPENETDFTLTLWIE